MLAQDIVLQVIQGNGSAEKFNEGLIPGPPEDTADVLDAFDRVMVDNQLQGGGIV